MSDKQDQQDQQNSGANNVGPQNDEAFTAFLFAIVSCIMLFVYGPLLFRVLSEIISRIRGTSKKKKRYSTKKKASEDPSHPDYDPVAATAAAEAEGDDTSVLAEGFEDVQYVFNGAKYCLQNPATIKSNIAAMRSQPGLTWTYIFPRVRRFVVRPKIILLASWFILLSSVLYNTLTYDPYAVLGLDAATASFGEVKKVYRSLTKINHPDHNKTDAAKAIFPKIKKAYKTIANKEKGIDEKEEQPEEFSVGIALPSWMISGKSKGFTMLVLIGALVAVPVLLFRALGQNQNSQLEGIYNSVGEGNQNIEEIFKRLGIPEDKQLSERRSNRMKFFNALADVGAIDRNMPPTMIDQLPPIREFRLRLQTRKSQMVQQFPFLRDDTVYKTLLDRLNKEEEIEKQRKLDEQKAKREQNQNGDSNAASSDDNKVSQETIDAEVFLLQQVLLSLFQELEVYTNIIGAETTTVRKTLRVHDSISDNIKEFSKNDGKLPTKKMAELTESVRKLEDLYKELREAADTIREHRMRQKMEEAQKLQDALQQSRDTSFDDE